MKLELKTVQFRDAFFAAGSVSPSRTPKPVIQNVKVQADKTGVILIGTDTENSIRRRVSEANCVESGEVLLPVDRFGEMLRKMDSPDLTINVKNDKAVISCGRASWNLPTHPAIDFPDCGDFVAKDYWTVPSNEFKKCLHRTSYATATSQAAQKNAAYYGVNLDVLEGGVLAFAATDDRRLSVAETKCETVGQPAFPIVKWKNAANQDMTGPLSVIMPQKLIGLIERCLGDSESPLKLYATAGALIVQNEDTTIHGRLLEGRYTKYRRAFRESNPINCDIPIAPFYSTLSQALTVTSDTCNSVILDFRKDVLTVRCKSEIGEFNSEMPLAYDQSDVELEIVPRFIIDYLKQCDALVVHCGMLDAEHHVEFSVPGYLGFVQVISKEE